MNSISSAHSSPTQKLVSSPLSSTLTLCVLATLVFGLNIFVITPFLAEKIGTGIGNISYIVIRLVVFVGLAHLLGRLAQRNRFQTLSTVMVVAFMDQVVMKGIFILTNPGMSPALEGVSQTEVLYGVSTGFLFFAPIVLILAFAGYEMIPARLRREKWKETPPGA